MEWNSACMWNCTWILNYREGIAGGLYIDLVKESMVAICSMHGISVNIRISSA